MAEGVRDIAYFLKWEVGTNLGGANFRNERVLYLSPTMFFRKIISPLKNWSDRSSVFGENLAASLIGLLLFLRFLCVIFMCAFFTCAADYVKVSGPLITYRRPTFPSCTPWEQNLWFYRKPLDFWCDLLR